MCAETATELIVARYAEELRWLRKLQRAPHALRVTIYDKHPSAPYPGARRLPNIGREAHTYLHHLVTRYETLAPLTVFCQGHPFDHAFDFHHTLRRLCAGPHALREEEGFEWLGHLVDTDDARGERLFVAWSKNEDGRPLDMNGFHRALFGAPGPSHYTFRGGAQFAVTRERVLCRPRSFYARALQLATTFPDAAHCFERAWPLVFDVKNPDREWLGERWTAYLKPMRVRG